MLNIKKALTELSDVVTGLKTTVASHTTRLQNFKVVVSKYFGNDTEGQTHTYTLETGCCYLMCVARTNSAAGCGLYVIQAHTTTSQILAVSATSNVEPTISGVTLRVKINSNYGQIHILKLGPP